MTELGTAPPPAASESDEQALLQRLRSGEDAAFGELFELHAAAVRRLARSLAADRSEAEDITAETFFRVLQALRRGSGPRDYVRAYLLTVARRVSWEWHGARRDVPVTDDELTFRAGAGADTPARTAEHTLITTAFTSLPERWRTVLWQTEVEGEQPAMVAPHFGLSANATAALARRARQGLRAAYLQAHLSVNQGPDSCRTVVEKLGGFTAGSVTGAEAQRIKAHLLGCPSCRATQDELREVCSSLRAHAGVIVLALPALAGGLGGATGLAATVKSVLFGSKVKVGLALVSAAAAGVVGVTAGPVVFGTHPMQTVGLGGGAPELALQPPSSRVQPPPQVQPGSRIVTGELQGTARPPRSHTIGYRGGLRTGVELGANVMPNLPAGTGPSVPGPPSSEGSARDDVTGSSPSVKESTLSTQNSTEPRLDTRTDQPEPGDPGCDGDPSDPADPTFHTTLVPTPPVDPTPVEPPSVTTTPTPTGGSTSGTGAAPPKSPGSGGSGGTGRSDESAPGPVTPSPAEDTSEPPSSGKSSQTSGSTDPQGVTGSADSESTATA
ncbi:sigma-70 family RNA polymerase sigma factor [Amycolatopsis sp. PS_44_ISF1]|uniref:sigma-70 family RNA polymerase sigma factor n=1 Tax=Amycolatopsis sp. PS_44_ISF1 TaxID=2974917 RepID=UPI0028DD83E4|nr:sigma-70 family RNA polymerase sigma factor [Amycolatopsis sp. PS_44_ISF1]MDT8910348.1 sigma-70 family RNA polymerase sigma factor [Amycolatopsis sp. PS_44_ISF1]